MVHIDKALPIPCELSGNFFYIWLTFFTPLHKLTPSVTKIAAEILRHRYILSKSITDANILDKYLMTNEEIRNDIIKACGISLSNYHVGVGKLRQAKFFIDGNVNPKLIPPIEEGSTSINLLFMFKLQDVAAKKQDGENIQKGS